MARCQQQGRAMRELKHLFENNKRWAEQKLKSDPTIFKRLSEKQTPKYLWIGCSDSRVPASELIGLQPGELFVHRNIANLFPQADLNSHSVLQFAIEALQIEHIIVCGHYGCGGVEAAIGNKADGIIDQWLHPVHKICAHEKENLAAIDSPSKQSQYIVELNAKQQVKNICQTPIVQNTWASGKKLCLHAWVYDIATGLIKDLNYCISSQTDTL